MKSKAFLLGILLGVGFTATVLYLFGVQFAAGDVYPEYSSLRADPSGAKLLFEALSHTPGITASRNYLPLDGFTETSAAVVLLGVQPGSFTTDSEMQQRLERL